MAGPHIKSGRLRALAVTSAQAWPGAPGISPVALTLPDFDVRSWLGLAAPKGLPDPIVSRLNMAVAQALRTEEVQQALTTLGSEPAPDTPQQMHALVENEVARWRQLMLKIGLAPM